MVWSDLKAVRAKLDELDNARPVEDVARQVGLFGETL
jgi:hypothetical protein